MSSSWSRPANTTAGPIVMTHGHGLVALLPGKAGAPLGKMVNLISGLGDKKGQRMGAPVDVKVGPDGNVYLVEDRPGRVIRLQYQAAK